MRSRDAATAVSSRDGDRSTDSIDAEPKPAEAKSRRLNPIKRKQMEDRLREIEEEITRAEAAIALCETRFQSSVSAEETQRQTHELALRKTDLQSLMNEWEELSDALETAGLTMFTVVICDNDCQESLPNRCDSTTLPGAT